MRTTAILVALYRAGQHIAGKMEDLLAQTVFKDCTVYLLNCQNLDNERSHYYKYLSLPNVVEITYNDYMKLYSSWNDAIKLGTEPLIVNANVDDRWHPEYLQRAIEALSRNPVCDVVMSDVYVTDKINLVWPNWSWHGMLTVAWPGGTCGPCPLWRRNLHDRFGYFGDYYVIGDADIWERWSTKHVRFMKIIEPLALYYQGQNLELRFDKVTGQSLVNIDIKQRLRGL